MSETPPPGEPGVPPDDETLIADDWPVRPEGQVVVEQSETETVPPRRGPVIWPWLLALLLLVLGGLGALYYFTQDDDNDAAATTATSTATSTAAQETAPAPVSVPDVVGTTSSEATAALREAGLEANLVAVPSDRTAGTVVAQSPAAGEEAPDGSTVRLNVAERVGETTTPTTTAATTTPAATTAPPPEPVAVPEVVGQELADAARTFGDEGLKVAVRFVPSSEPQGRVVAQAQPAGTERKRGDTVQLNVSTGAEPAAATAVPDVVGRRQDEGRRVLEQAGFEVLVLNLNGQVRNESPVASQTPSAGASIPRGSLVILSVGS